MHARDGGRECLLGDKSITEIIVWLENSVGIDKDIVFSMLTQTR